MDTFGIPFGTCRYLPIDVLKRFNAEIELRDRCSFSMISKVVYQSLGGISLLESRARALLDRTMQHISQDLHIELSHDPDEQETKKLCSLIKRYNKACVSLRHEKSLMFSCGDFMSVLNKMLESLKMVTTTESESFYLNIVENKLTVDIPNGIISKFSNLFHLKKKDNSYILELKTYPVVKYNSLTSEKWHYWIALHKADRSHMSLEGLQMRITMEAYLNALVRVVSQLNVASIPLLFHKFEAPLWKQVTIRSNSYGVFSLSRGLKIGDATGKWILSSDLKVCSMTVDGHGYLNKTCHVSTLNFIGFFREHVIDRSLQKNPIPVRSRAQTLQLLGAMVPALG
jgi:hypothetical protein